MNNLIVYFFVLSGAFFILVAAIGIVKFRDIFSRMHAATKAPSFGIFLIVIGMCIYFNQPVVYIKGLFIVLFVYLTAPLGAHAIIKSFIDSKDKEKFSGED